MRSKAKGFTREIQVGLFLLAGILVIAAFSFKITDTPILRGGTQMTTYLDDATGVFKNSKVKMAGIDIGVIRTIKLEAGRARITLLIDSGISIPDGAKIIPRPLGILGDKYLEIVPGGSLPSKPGASFRFPFSLIESAYAEGPKEALKEGSVLPSEKSGASLEEVTKQMSEVGKDLKAVSGILRQIMEGREEPNSSLGRTFRNAENLTGNVNDILVKNKTEIKELIMSLNRASKKLEAMFASVNDRQMRKDIKSLANSAGNLTRSLENIEKVTSRIERGEGTIGRLINDPATVDELNRTIRSMNSFLDRSRRLQLTVDLGGERGRESSFLRTYVGASIFSREDSGYMARVTIDEAGTTKRKITTTTIDNGAPSVTIEDENRPYGFRYSLQYYKKLWSLGIRVGLFESTGGMAVDVSFLGNRLNLGFETFDFVRENLHPNFRLYTTLKFWDYFYIAASASELFNSSLPNGGALTAGGGIRFTDEDFKTLTVFAGF